MKVLIGCEFSGVVRDAFSSLGHDAWSCDLLPTERDGNHIQGDVLDVLSDDWDLSIFHPLCTYLCVSGARWFKERPVEQEAALEFVRKLLDAPIHKIALKTRSQLFFLEFGRPTKLFSPMTMAMEKQRPPARG
jgi:hypothetical protein